MGDMNHNIWDSISAWICNSFWFIDKKTWQKLSDFGVGFIFYFFNPLLVTKLQPVYDQNSAVVYLNCQVPVAFKGTLLCNTNTY